MILVFNESNVIGGSEKVLLNLLRLPAFDHSHILAVVNNSNPIQFSDSIETVHINTPFDFNPRTKGQPSSFCSTSISKILSYFSSFFSILFLVFRLKPTSIYLHSGGFPSGFLNTFLFHLYFTIFSPLKLNLRLQFTTFQIPTIFGFP